MQEELIKNITKKYDLELLLLFGSRANGAHHQKSDFDIAYLSVREVNFSEEAQMIVDLAPLFKSDHIDLVNLKKAPPLLYYAIFKNAKVIYARDPFIFYNLRVYAFKKYVEARPLFEEKNRRVQEYLKQI